MPLLPDDRLLLERFREGDRAAMAAVFHTYADTVARFLRSGFSFVSAGRPMRFAGLADRFELHDFVAEAFRRAFEQRARLAYDGLAPYEVYLKRIARNIVIDRLRADRRLVVDTALAEAAAAGCAGGCADHSENLDRPLAAASPSALFDREELRQLIGGFIAGLSPDQQRLMTLRYQQDCSQEKVARSLNRSRRWVRTQEKRLRRRLLARMKNSGYLPPCSDRGRR